MTTPPSSNHNCRSITLRRTIFLMGLILFNAAFFSCATAQSTLRETRPDGNTGIGFFVKDGKIYDPNGYEYLIRGVNNTHGWGSSSVTFDSIAEIKKTQANTVRAAFGTLSWSRSASFMISVAEEYLDNELIVMLERHDATCDGSAESLAAIVDYWVSDEIATFLRNNESKVILNIANEWGNKNTPEVWVSSYKTAITRIRDAGINAMIVIDGGGNCGQFPRITLEHGTEVFNHDPQKNIAFSIHMYAFWLNPDDPGVGSWGLAPFDIRVELEDLKDEGLAIMVGEFSWQGSSEVTYSTRKVMEICEELGFGWLAWSWNLNSDSSLDLIKGGTSFRAYNSDDDLTDFGNLIVNDSELGLKTVSRPASIYAQLGDEDYKGKIILQVEKTSPQPYILEWHSLHNTEYRIEGSDDLLSWTTIDTVSGNGRMKAYPCAETNNDDKKFYRIAALPQ